MKKFTIIIICAFMLIACGRSAENAEDQTPGDSVYTGERTIAAEAENAASENFIAEVQLPTPTPTPTPVPVVTVSENEAEELPEEPEEEEEEEEEPPFVDGSEMVRNIIVDTDYSTDVDDVACIKVATSMATLGKINLCAVGTSTYGDYSTRGVHGQLACYGYAYVPTGYDPNGIWCESPFLEYFIRNYGDPGTYVPMDAVDLYKNVIRQNMYKEEKTRIVTTGYLNNISRLLMDPEGMQLVKNGVDSIWVVGGGYPEQGRDFNFWWKEECTLAVQTCVAYSPVPLVFITNSTGNCIVGDTITGTITGGFNLWNIDRQSRDCVSRAYRLFEEAHEGSDLRGGYNAQDSIAVWAAGCSFEESQMHITRIDAYIFEDGSNLFVPNPYGRHAVLERDHNNIAWYTLEINKYIDFGLY